MGITVKEIAALASCSATTVSKVLNNRDMNISEATRTKILAIAAEHNYIPNFMAKSLRGQKTNTLGFILPDISNPSYSQIAKGIEVTAQKRNFRIVFSDTDVDPKRVRDALNYLTSQMVDGIIFDQIVSPFDTNILPRNIPLVLLDRLEGSNAQDWPVGKVYLDIPSAVREITKMHIQSGSTKFAYISNKPLSLSDRYYVFRAALSEANIPFNEELVYWGSYDIFTGEDAVRKFLESGLQFDSIVCGHDAIAVGAMDVLKKNGYRIPQDVRVSGIGDVTMVRYLTPSLTTVKQFSYEMGELATNMLIDHIMDGKPLYHQKMNYEIKKRDSL